MDAVCSGAVCAGAVGIVFKKQIGCSGVNGASVLGVLLPDFALFYWLLVNVA